MENWMSIVGRGDEKLVSDDDDSQLAPIADVLLKLLIKNCGAQEKRYLVKDLFHNFVSLAVVM